MRSLCISLQAALFIILSCHQANADTKLLPLPAGSAQAQYVELGELGKSVRRGSRTAVIATTLPILQMPRWLFVVPEAQIQRRFARIWHLSGPQFCQKLREKGITVSQWQPAASGRSKIYECFYEVSYQANDKSSSQTLFLIVRGKADGTISSVRAKISFEATGTKMHLLPEVTTVLYQLLAMQNWFDSQSILFNIQKLQNIKKEEFGASISFLREKQIFVTSI